jgi:serine/threonine protein kinase
MAPLTPAELLAWLGAEQFLDPAQVVSIRETLADYPDARALARELLRRDWITAYQANQILQGKGELLILGAYRLSERLAEGAMGQVFKAWHPRLRRVVAVKTLNKEMVASPKAIDRFFREIRLAAQLDHPHIVRALDADEQDGRPYLAMEFVDGTNLAVVLKQQGPLPIPEGCEYARQAALGLQHAFDRGIVHRDIKPSNLILTGPRPGARDEGQTVMNVPGNAVVQPTVKILDFGLARFESEEDEAKNRRLTQFGKILGTIDYIAPEQAADSRTADIRADIYSLGCTLYTLLTGEPAFAGDDVVTKLIARSEKEPPGLCTLRHDAPVDLEAVVKKMMARRPEDRFQTPADAAMALQPFTPAPTVNLSAETKSLPPGGPLVPAELPSDAQPEYAEAHAAVLAAEPETQADPLAFDLDDGSAPATTTRRSARKTAGAPLGWILGGAAAVLVLAVLGWALSGLFTAAPVKKSGYPDTASVQIEKAYLSTDKPLNPGDRKRILVEISRTGFEGPVKIQVDKTSLPDGVQTGSGTIAEKRTKGELSLTVSFGTDPLEADLKVVAVADNLRGEKTLPVKVVQPK